MAEEDKYEDPTERRQLRFQYRQLITDTEQNRHEFVQPESDGLHIALGKGDQLFHKVRRTREAALDSQFLVLVSNLGNEQAQHIQTGIVTFEPRTFAEKLITFMGGRHVDDGDGGGARHVNFDALDWSKVGQIASRMFRKTQPMEFMHGPLSMDAPVRKQKQPSAPKTGEKPGAVAKVTPEQLLKVEDNHEEATTKEVLRVFQALEMVTDQGENEELKPVSFFEFVTNPHSFSQTVENIFHLSFLVNKGNVSIELDKNDLPVVCLADPETENDRGERITKRHQVVMPFTMNDWKNVISIYSIKKPMIPTRKTTRREQSLASQRDNMEED